MPDKILYLYGGDQPWASDLWVTSDDRVRGGASQSHLSVITPEHARFHGHLDTTALGGAGFASQHSIGQLSLNLTGYDGIIVAVRAPHTADGKRYVLTLKNEILPRRGDGREQSTVSWEAEFVADDEEGDVKLAWRDFKPTYRGREKKDADELDLSDVKRVGLMMRSFFGEQEGDFELNLSAIAAWKQAVVVEDDEDDDSLKAVQIVKQRNPWWKGLLCGLI